MSKRKRALVNSLEVSISDYADLRFLSRDFSPLQKQSLECYIHQLASEYHDLFQKSNPEIKRLAAEMEAANPSLPKLLWLPLLLRRQRVVTVPIYLASNATLKFLSSVKEFLSSVKAIFVRINNAFVWRIELLVKSPRTFFYLIPIYLERKLRALQKISQRINGATWRFFYSVRISRTPNIGICDLAIIFEDSGSNIGLYPALEIKKAAEKNGKKVKLISPSIFVERQLENDENFFALKSDNIARSAFLYIRSSVLRLTVLMAGYSFNHETVDLNANEQSSQTMSQLRLKSYWLRGRLSQLCETVVMQRAVFRWLFKGAPVTIKYLMIYPPSPICKVAVGYKGCNIDNVFGFYPALVGDRPDGKDFPLKNNFVYGEQLVKLARSFVDDNVNFVVTGSPMFDIHLRRSVPIQKLNDKKRSKFKKNILLISENYPDPDPEMSFYLDVLADFGVDFDIRLHPSEDQTLFARRFSKKIGKGKIQKNKSLEKALSDADLVLGINSNIFIQALNFGVCCFSLDLSSKARALSMKEHGICDWANDEKSAYELLEFLILGDCSLSDRAQKFMKGIYAFNGINDGKSAERIVEKIFQIG